MAKAKDKLEDAKPYVKRALQDEELRDNLRSAYATARDEIRLTGSTPIASQKADEMRLTSSRNPDRHRTAFPRRPGNETAVLLRQAYQDEATRRKLA